MMRTIAAVLFALLFSPALAQYPSKPVRVIIHFPAGGSTDYVARVLSQALSAAGALATTGQHAFPYPCVLSRRPDSFGSRKEMKDGRVGAATRR
jgi:hypothetical protein